MDLDFIPSFFARLRAGFEARQGRPPEPAPVILVQRRIYVLPTPAGFGFAIAMGVLLVASINYTLSLGYALTFLLSGSAIASVIHAFRNLLRLSIRYGKTEPVFCGDPVVYRLLIDNPAPRRRPALAVRNQGFESRFELAPSGRTEVGLSLPTSRRGLQPLGSTVIETRWPLGLIRAWSVFTPALEAVIYPAPEPRPPLPPANSGGIAEGNGAAQNGDDDFAGLRNYQHSDSPRHLAWKVFARGGELMAKQFSTVEGGDLLFDWYLLPATLDEESRLSRLAAWLLQSERSGQRYALKLPGVDIPFEHGEVHLRRCLTALALHGLAWSQR
jgi:uncharacterized protein (DUF58 family)